MQLRLKLLIIHLGIWNLVCSQRILNCNDLKGENGLLYVITDEDITIECNLSPDIKKCVWTPQNSSYPECEAPMDEDSSITFVDARPNYKCSFRPGHCSLSFTSMQRENMGVWTLASVSSTNAFYQYFAILVRTSGDLSRSLIQPEMDDSCFLPDVIYMTKASVFQRIDEVESPKECQLRCQEIVNCTHWTWADLEMKSLSKACFLQNGDNVVQKKRLHYVSGPKHCTDPESNLKHFPRMLDRPDPVLINQAKLNGTTIIVSIGGGLILVVGVMASLVRRYSLRTERDYNSLDMTVDLGQPIPVAKLTSLVQRKVVPLPNEFKRLTDADRAKNVIVKSRDMGKSKMNAPLNRVRHILPYDESRLTLNTKIEESDYINASIMPRIEHIGNLIACQIPNEETEDRYWQMIMENQINVVVNLDESNLWTTNANNMNVQLPNGSTIILKEHSTQMNKTKSMIKTNYRFNSRQVEHFSFNAWNKHQIPKDLSTFCSLIESVMHLTKTELNLTNGSILVQCYDGSTKSGFFIACLIIAFELGTQSETSVHNTVFALRECRSLVVPNEVQYRAVYEVVSMLAKIYKRASSKRKSSSIITTV